MRLTRLVMQGFRSYREPVEVRFEPGTNVFLGRNEAGKTGILLAIQAALYPPRLATEREAYVSAGSDACRVGLEYELPDGRTIRVDRDLVAHKGAIAELRETGPVTLATAPGDIAQIVREHTGCDEALFRATLLVRHEGVEIGDADDLTRSLSERIEVLVSGSPGGISAARAVRKLEEKVKGLSGPRAGEITQAEARLRDAESRLGGRGLGGSKRDGRGSTSWLGARASWRKSWPAGRPCSSARGGWPRWRPGGRRWWRLGRGSTGRSTPRRRSRGWSGRSSRPGRLHRLADSGGRSRSSQCLASRG